MSWCFASCLHSISPLLNDFLKETKMKESSRGSELGCDLSVMLELGLYQPFTAFSGFSFFKQWHTLKAETKQGASVSSRAELFLAQKFLILNGLWMTSYKLIYYFKMFVNTPPPLLVIKGTKSKNILPCSKATTSFRSHIEALQWEIINPNRQTGSKV